MSVPDRLYRFDLLCYQSGIVLYIGQPHEHHPMHVLHTLRADSWRSHVLDLSVPNEKRKRSIWAGTGDEAANSGTESETHS